ncbi:MAG: zinc-dependent alcohol dehydrogenase family protein [Ignavibacteriaceae bacterium]
MKAAIFKGPNQLSVDEYSLPRLEKDQVLIKVDLCGLCGTDFHIYSGEAPSKASIIPGHEYVGTIADFGSAVEGLNIDDHVAIDPNIYCGQCYHCRNGKINFCANLKALGVTLNGGFAEYSIVPSSQAYLIPKNLSFKSAAFAEPLSCCVHGMDQASIKLGESVGIIGGGTIGLLMLQLVKISGAGKIILIEPILSKRETAVQLGADYTFDPNSPDMYDKISELTSGGPDVMIECAGNSQAANLALKLTKKGGRIVVFGLSGKKDAMIINLQNFFHKELEIKGSLLNPFTFARSVELLVTKKVDVESFQPVLSRLDNLKDILQRPRDFSVIKYQVSPN